MILRGEHTFLYITAWHIFKKPVFPYVSTDQCNTSRWWHNEPKHVRNDECTVSILHIVVMEYNTETNYLHFVYHPNYDFLSPCDQNVCFWLIICILSTVLVMFIFPVDTEHEFKATLSNIPVQDITVFQKWSVEYKTLSSSTENVCSRPV